MSFSAQQFASRQRGLTIVELMIAMLIGAFLIGGAIQVFVGNRVMYSFNDGVARIQENARVSLEQIAQTARMSGYRGCFGSVGVFNNLAAPNNVRDDIVNGVQGYDARGTIDGDLYNAAAMDPAPGGNPADWVPALPVELRNLVIPGSDVLMLRGATGPVVPLVAPFSDPNQIFVDPGHGFVAGDLLVTADCQKASLFQLTSVGGAGAAEALVHGGSGGYSPGNGTTTWPTDQDYGFGSEVSRYQAYAFYVGQGASGRPSLFQLRLQLTAGGANAFVAEELVEGIDTMQIRYGVDTDNDEDIDNWLSGNAVVNWTQVLSVEVSLLSRSAEEYGTETDQAIYNLGTVRFDPVDDRRFRQVFSTTIGIRNRLP
ncbi:MAG: PilW family protein [Pseudomonadota bacterium]